MRWPRWIKRIAWKIATTLPLLLALPLAGQQTVVVPDVNVVVEPTPLEVQVDVEVMSDSVRLARIADATEAIAEAIAECGCVDQGTSTVVQVGQGALVLAAFFIGWQLKRIADRPGDTHTTGPTNVEVNVPEHDHGRKDREDSESH